MEVGIISEERKVPEHFPFLHEEFAHGVFLFVFLAKTMEMFLFKFIILFAKSKKLLKLFFYSLIDNEETI